MDRNIADISVLCEKIIQEDSRKPVQQIIEYAVTNNPFPINDQYAVAITKRFEWISHFSRIYKASFDLSEYTKNNTKKVI